MPPSDYRIYHEIRMKFMRFKIIIKRIFIYFILVFVAFLLECCVFPMFDFLYSIPNLLLVVTSSYGFIYGSTTGIICGIFSGLLLDSFYSMPFGLNILIFSFIGFLSGLFKRQLRSDRMAFPLMLCILGEVVYNFCLALYRYLLYGRLDFTYTILNVFLPELIFSLLVTLISYRVFLMINHRMDDIDKVRGEEAA